MATGRELRVRRDRVEYFIARPRSSLGDSRGAQKARILVTGEAWLDWPLRQSARQQTAALPACGRSPAGRTSRMRTG